MIRIAAPDRSASISRWGRVIYQQTSRMEQQRLYGILSTAKYPDTTSIRNKNSNVSIHCRNFAKVYLSQNHALPWLQNSTVLSGSTTLASPFYCTRRTFFFSSKKPDPAPTSDNESAIVLNSFDDEDHMNNTPDIGDAKPSVDETLNKLFEEQTNTSDAWYATAETAAANAWDPCWYNVADNAILAIHAIQEATHLSYGLSIVATTVVLRLALFPVMVHAQRTASRMAHVQPELNVLKERYERLSSPTRNDQLQFSTNMKALFKKYKVNPFSSVLAPAIQIPLFIGMFFGIKKVSTYFPDELKAGGFFWFTDLTVPDPLYLLPALSSATFLLLVELGKDQMLRAGGSSVAMLNVMRFLCIVSMPLVANFEAAMLVYWVSNNLLSCAQTALLKATPVRKFCGILEPPKPPPGMDLSKDSLVSSVSDLVKRAQGKPITEAQLIQKHNQEVEAKKVSFRLTRAARERERRKAGITGTRNY
jgi:YidC/Oxa1 family membrane protein insertase